MSSSVLQEIAASFAVGWLGAVVGWRQPVRRRQLCVEGCFVQSSLSFSLRCQSFPAGCGMYFVCLETLACFDVVSVLETIEKIYCLE